MSKQGKFSLFLFKGSKVLGGAGRRDLWPAFTPSPLHPRFTPVHLRGDMTFWWSVLLEPGWGTGWIPFKKKQG